ncbi:MAG TPA: glutamate-5-semialdehyde dehydrogenase [Gammaproteobacteria bacterium]|nr:glutamate-5-semialdehyde dehydrogenase [Gammaproteobacteria bacterium]
MTIEQTLREIGARAKAASTALQLLTSDEKNAILQAMADELHEQREIIKRENAKDLAFAQNAQLASVLIDRLILDDARIDNMIASIRRIAMLPDPVGKILHEFEKTNGLLIKKIRTPIGVIAMIYESRPNVTADVSALCLKTSNAVILRGGKEALQTNQAILELLLAAGYKTGLPQHAMQLITIPDHDAVRQLIQMPEYIDLAIPRGGPSLINMVVEHARVPVIKHDKGVCHTFVDKTAQIDMALNICVNAKCQRPGVCNAMESLLVHEAIADTFLPRLQMVMAQHHVRLKGDHLSRKILPMIEEATETDWYTEYYDLILSIKIVKDVSAAIYHINHYGSHHSDAIVSEDLASQQLFVNQVDSSAVYINASTRFTDGGEFGMGAEIGISTDKLHARGPMGLEELCSYKWVVHGSGQVRE